MVLNEPETSLHPELIKALARLIGKAAGRSQLIVVTHQASLIAALNEQSGCHSILLEKTFGETTVAGSGNLNITRWQWPSR
jgi:predicted ATPase